MKSKLFIICIMQRVLAAGELNAGMYLYSLIADGQLVDTKQMILTK